MLKLEDYWRELVYRMIVSVEEVRFSKFRYIYIIFKEIVLGVSMLAPMSKRLNQEE